MRALILLVLAVLVPACSLPVYQFPEQVPNASALREVHIVSHGWHTGIVLSSAEIATVLPQLRERFGNAPYLEFGWGHQEFYQARQVTAALVLRAVLWPSPSVLHVVALRDPPAQHFQNTSVHKICLDDRQHASLLQFVAASFARQNERLVPLQRGLYGESHFYRAQETYHLLNNCNKWTAKALNSAGVKIRPAFKLTADSVLSSVVRHAKAQQDIFPGSGPGCAGRSYVPG